MKSKVQEAKNKHKNGYNCWQAVVCTYAPMLGLDELSAFKAAEAFGLGIAKRYETCGSVCGMMILAGLKNSDGNMTKPASKFSTFDLGRAMCEQFEKWNGTCTCAKLRGTDVKTDRLRSRRGCVADCARITEDFLFKGEFEPYEERRADEE